MGRILFLGVEGSGKTTLAMALVKAFARHEGEGWYLRPADRGAYNFAAIAPEDFAAAAAFPSQTANVREMSWTIERDGAEVGGLRILDYPGEVYRLAFLDPDGEPDPAACRARLQANKEELDVLRGAIDEATDLYVLFNLQDALNLSDDDANRSAVWVTNECLKKLKTLPSKPCVTLVFTQVDRYQTEDDFLHGFSPAELDLIGHDHPDIDWMMVSVMVPPESEFGIDAFVRRCTAQGQFGVPDGRPRRAAAGPTGALKRLAAQQAKRETSSGEADTADEASSASPATAPSENASHGTGAPSPARRRLLSAVLLLLISAGVTAGLLFLRHRPRPVPAAVPVPVAASPETAARAEKKAAGPQDGKMAPDGIPEAPKKNAAPSVDVRQELEREIEQSYTNALTCATPQEAHALLTFAAEEGHLAAMCRLAQIYDIWGWGGFVRMKESASAHWTSWLRRIDLLGEKRAVCVSRPPENAASYRTLAMDWYRAAALGGSSAAVEALARHERLARKKSEAKQEER